MCALCSIFYILSLIQYSVYFHPLLRSKYWELLQVWPLFLLSIKVASHFMWTHLLQVLVHPLIIPLHWRLLLQPVPDGGPALLCVQPACPEAAPHRQQLAPAGQGDVQQKRGDSKTGSPFSSSTSTYFWRFWLGGLRSWKAGSLQSPNSWQTGWTS